MKIKHKPQATHQHWLKTYLRLALDAPEHHINVHLKELKTNFEQSEAQVTGMTGGYIVGGSNRGSKPDLTSHSVDRI